MKSKSKKIALIEVAKSIRKPMPPSTVVHGKLKYKRERKNWKCEDN